MNSQHDNNPSAQVRYLTVSDLYNINFTVTGGDTFVRDIHLLESAAKRPQLVLFGQPQFPTLLDKAAALLYGLAYHHLFVDGNKRTATRATAYFLELNGLAPSWDAATVQQFALEVAQGQHDIEAIAAWLGDHTKPDT
jgi:death on curing protein